ncbi:DUF5776 domain-containing protein [Levilactobacillus angrenensis]|uniref:DUF5776 domain-containing protein n=1 Tax=Levilactobacillus angrenensis TaxID=2486020 RepID=A0ABW1UC83_9LACO|nr:DUF5776 domain-containing protein [Levilactobacillus angrenensis]
MKISTVGLAVVAGLTLGSVQELGGFSAISLPGIGSMVTAKAATATDAVVDESPVDVDSSDNLLQGCSWKMTADGVLHLKSGTLPIAYTNDQNNTYPPFFNLMNIEANKGYVVTTISFDGSVNAPVNAAFLFGNFLTKAPKIENLNRLDTSQSTDFAYMFYKDQSQNLDVSSLNTSKATDLHGMFMAAKGISGYEHFDTGNVKDVGDLFNSYEAGNGSATVDLSQWDLSKVVPGDGPTLNDRPMAGGFQNMFASSEIKRVDLGNAESFSPTSALEGIFADSTVSEITLNPKDNMNGSGLKGPDETQTGYTGKWENIKDQYIKGEKPTYDTEGLVAMYSPDSSTTPTDNETYIWEPVTTPGNPVTVHYVDQNGKTIQADKQVPGDYGATYNIAPDKIAGYDYVGFKDGSLTGTYDSDAKEVTLTYKKATPTTGGTATEPATDSTSEATSETPEADQPQTNPTNPVAKKNRAITAVKKLGLYRTPNFSKRTRIAYYPKQSRTKRPQFVILGVAQSKNGVKRYLVRDVNHGTKRDGKAGYITAKQAFSNHTYYQSNPKTVKVLARVNGYRNKALKHQVKTYQPGKILHVKKLVHYRLTTRLVLRDGTFVTGNKVKLIMQ